MSDPVDDKMLDEYLKGGSMLSQRYRELGTDAVPPELDRRVLEQARAAALEAPRASRAWLRWSAPLAVAASAVLVLAIVTESGVREEAAVRSSERQEAAQAKLQLQSDQDPSQARDSLHDAPSAMLSLPPAAPAPAEPEVDRRKSSAEPVPLQARSDARRREEEKVDSASFRQEEVRVITESPAAQSAALAAAPPPTVEIADAANPEPQPARTPGATAQLAAHAMSEYGARQENARTTSLSRAAAPVEESRAEESYEVSPPQDAQSAFAAADPRRWLEEIRRLRQAGKAQEAEREWRSFLLKHPDYVVAPDDPARQKP